MRKDTFKRGECLLILDGVPAAVPCKMLLHVPGLAVVKGEGQWRLVHACSGYVLGWGYTADACADMADAVADLFDWTLPALHIVQDLQSLALAARRLREVWSSDWEKRHMKKSAA